MNFIEKNICSFKNIKTILVFGKENAQACEIIKQVLGARFKTKKTTGALPTPFSLFRNDVFVIEINSNSKEFLEKVANFIKLSDQNIFVGALSADDSGNIPEIAQLARQNDFFVYNFDGEKSRRAGEGLKSKNYSVGFEQGADFRASDLRENGGINYKINFQGKSIPVWQNNSSGKEFIYQSLAASAVATILGMNFVEISEALKRCKVQGDKVE
jgi:hypothetical protein